MKNPIEFSNRRPHDKTGQDMGGSATSIKSHFAHTSMFDSQAKVAPKNQATQDLFKRRSPDHLRNFIEPKGSALTYHPASMFSNLKNELSSLKQEVTKLTTVNTFEPLQFKPRSKLDKMAPSSQQNINNSIQAKIQEYYQQTKSIRNEEDDLRRDLKRLKSQYCKEDPEDAPAQGFKGAQIKQQTQKIRNQAEELKDELERERSTCRQLKEQVDKLRYELKSAGEREKQILDQKKQLIERLNSRGNEQTQESYDKKILELVEGHNEQKMRLEAIRSSEVEQMRRQLGEMERNIQGLQKRLMMTDSEQKQAKDSTEDLLRRRDREISILKQEIGILQQLTSTRVAEQNCLQLQKQSMERMCQHKDSQNKRLQKDVADLKERLESERAFNSSVSEKLTMKNMMIQSLETEVQELRIQLLQAEVSRRPRLLQCVPVINLQILTNQDLGKLAAKPQILERRRTCTTQTTSPLQCSQCSVGLLQENEHKQNILYQKPKYFDTLFDTTRTLHRDRSSFDVHSNTSSRVVQTSRREESSPLPSPLREANSELEKQLATTKNELNSTYLQLLQTKAQNCKLTDKLNREQQEVRNLTAELQGLRKEIVDLHSAAITTHDKHTAQLTELSNRIIALQSENTNLADINQQLNQQNQDLTDKLRRQETKPPVTIPAVSPPAIPVNEQQTKQIEQLRTQVQQAQHQLQEARNHIGGLDHHIQSLNRRLRKTDDLLCQSNDLIHRMNLNRLAERLQRQASDR